MFNLFRKKPEPQELVKNWRTGMWVMVNGAAGILHKLNPVEVHLVNPAGETVSVLFTELSALRQANWLEIPEPRRPSIERAKELGYGT